MRPVPWSQDGEEWGHLHQPCAEQAELNSLCLLCGEFVLTGYVFWYLWHAYLGRAEIDPEAYVSFEDLGQRRVIDRAPLHERCAKLTAAHCPTLKDDMARGRVYLMPYHHRPVLYGLA